MEIEFDTVRQLNEILLKVAKTFPELDATFEPQVRIADARFGDLQANGLLPWAKQNKTNPRALAEKFLAHLHASGELDPQLVNVEIAGPGFLNISFTSEYRLRWIRNYRNESIYKQAASDTFKGKKVIIDFSSPNTAKQMHVGHIRSTVIGEAVSRLLEFCGATTLRDNHIGDWGTQFGLIILGVKNNHFDVDAPHDNPIADLERIYKETSALAKENPSVMESARAELVKLQNGDAENTRLWKAVNDLSLKTFQQAYDTLGVRFDVTLGESFYCDKVQRIYDELTAIGLATESDGALVVFHPEHPRFNEQPFIIRKSDGASNYGTTDLATVLYRVEHYGAQEIIYLTDARQSDHFEQLFLTVEKWFKAKKYPLPTLRHVTFGTILGDDGKAIKTRSGEPVRLMDLIAESCTRAYEVVKTKNPQFAEEELCMIADCVGVNALRYADLMQNRTTNYTFSWDKMLSFEGNTAPYLLYAVARLHSIFRKANLTPDAEQPLANAFETAEEIALARKLMSFPAALKQSLEDLRPHHVCTWLYELAGDFSTFYNLNRVIVDEPSTQARRLLLCSRTLRTLETGLRLLGVEPLERM